MHDFFVNKQVTFLV